MFGLQVCISNYSRTLFNKYIPVEFLLNKKSLYISGPNMPFRLNDHAMVTSPTGKGVISMGGGIGEDSKAMFELSQSMEWTRLEQNMQIKHFGRPLAIPIPDEMVSKQN